MNSKGIIGVKKLNHAIMMMDNSVALINRDTGVSLMDSVQQRSSAVERKENFGVKIGARLVRKHVV